MTQQSFRTQSRSTSQPATDLGDRQPLHRFGFFPGGRRRVANVVKSSPRAQENAVTVVTQFFPPDYAATGQLLEELTAQLGLQGMQIRVLTGQPGYSNQQSLGPAVETRTGVRIWRSRTSRLWPQRIRGRAINGLLFVLRSGLCLLHPRHRSSLLLLTTEPPYLPFLGYLTQSLLGLPYICLLYDVYPDVLVELRVLPATHWLVRLWEQLNRRVWERSRAIVVLSDTMQERILAKCPSVAGKLTAIHSWADPRQIVPIAKAENPFARAHQLVERFTVAYSGNMGRCHDIETLLAAARELQAEDVQFLFVGGGAKYEPCVQMAADWGLKNCRFLPFQPKCVLPHSLTACDLALVTISRGLEGAIAPSKLYGILAAGRPVAAVCESHSYLRPLLRAAGCGAAFDNGDSTRLADFIRQLAGDRPRAERMGRAGRDYLKRHFTPEIIAQQYAELLRASAVAIPPAPSLAKRNSRSPIADTDLR